MQVDYEGFVNRALTLRATYFTPHPIDPEGFLADCLIFCREYPELAAKHAAAEAYRICGGHMDAPLKISDPSNRGILTSFQRKALFRNASHMAQVCLAALTQNHVDGVAKLVALATFQSIFHNHLATIHTTLDEHKLLIRSCAWLCGNAR